MSDAEYKQPMIVAVFYVLGVVAIIAGIALLVMELTAGAVAALIGGLLYLGLAQVADMVARTHWRNEQISDDLMLVRHELGKLRRGER